MAEHIRVLILNMNVFPATMNQNSMARQQISICFESVGMMLSNDNLLKKFDIVILSDLEDNIDVIGTLYKYRGLTDIPFVIVSKDDTLLQRLNSFHAGADDFLGSGFDIEELVARIRAIVYRYNFKAESDAISPPRGTASVSAQIVPARPPTKKKVTFSGYCIDTNTMVLYTSAGEVKHLARNEITTLLYLIDNSHRLVKKKELHEHLHKSDSNPRSIDVTVSRLRKKLGDRVVSPSIIKTIRGEGYSFISEFKIHES